MEDPAPDTESPAPPARRVNHWGIVTSILGAMLLILSLAYTAKMGEAMATTSLLNDEFYSTEKFTSQGPLYVLTNYPAANNHVFFNLLRSVTPGASSYLPMGARWWSFVFVVLFFGLVIGYFAKRGLLFEGTLAMLPFLLSERFLDQALQARAFGLVFFLTALVVISVVEYVRTRKLGWLVTLGLAVFFSSWALPPAVMLGGLMMICLVPFDWKRVILTGILTVSAILLVYSPILADIAKESAGYTYGEYDTPLAPMRTLALYWFSKGFVDTQIASWTVAGLVVVVPLLIGVVRWPQHRAEILLTSCSVALFAVFIAMKTPIHRTACYTLIPLAMSFALAVGKWWDAPDRRMLPWLRCLVALALLIAMAPRIFASVRDFRYIPPEDHLAPAVFINEQFPTTLPIASPHAVAAAMHLIDNPGRLVYELDPEKVADGKQLILDNRRRIGPDTPRMTAEEISSETIAIDFPELSTGYQRLLFTPADRENLESFSLGQKAGTTSGRSWELEVQVKAGSRFLNFHSPKLSLTKPPEFRLLHGDKKDRIDPEITYHSQLAIFDLVENEIDSEATILIYFTSTEPVDTLDQLRLQVWAH